MGIQKVANRVGPPLEPAHSIKVVSELTRLPMGTLRAWERRYGFPKPQRRADSNRRLYPADQLERLKVIARTLEHGYRPGDVIHKPTHELLQLLTPTAAGEGSAARTIANVATLIALLSADDAKGIEDELRLGAAALGAKRFVTDLAQPLAQAVGEAWAEGKLAIRHEHLMTECLTTQLRALLAAHQDADGSPSILLSTLPGEPHTLGLQMVALYLALSSAKPRLLGASTPPEQILSAAQALGASVVGIAVTPGVDLPATRRHVRRLAQGLQPSTTLWVGGAGAAALGKLPPRAQALSSWAAIDKALAHVRRGV